MNMNTLKTALVSVAMLAVGFAHAEELTGRQIMDEASARHDRDIEFEVQKMTLKGADGTVEEVRDMRRYVRKEDGAFKYLMVFDDPAGVAGVALLTWENPTGADDQFLYLPSMGKKLKRIADGGKRNYFMGTDFTYEDLVSESRDKFAYERLADVEFDGQAAFQVSAVPTDDKLKRTSGYKSRTLTVLKDSFFIVQTDYFDRRGRPLKVLTALEYGPVEGDMWRASKQEINNSKEKHITEVEVVSRDFAEESVPSKYFGKRHITSGRHMR